MTMPIAGIEGPRIHMDIILPTYTIDINLTMAIYPSTTIMSKNRIPPIALGTSNWLFAASRRAGERAANILSLIQSAKLNDHDPHRYLEGVLEPLPTQPASRLEELVPHRWQSGS
jgi:hypothetical protein